MNFQGARVGMTALLLQCCVALGAAAQEPQPPPGIGPVLGPGATSLFVVDAELLRPAAESPSLTVTGTEEQRRPWSSMPEPPPLRLGGAPLAPQLGDQALPRTFTASPWAGNAVRRPIRGVSVATTGQTAWNLAFGQLHSASGPPARTADTGGVVAMGVDVTSKNDVTVTSRALVPVGGDARQTSVGTGIRADVTHHLSFTSDVGAAGTAGHGWDPLAAAGVMGHWNGAELETKVVRGTPPAGTPGEATVGSLDREIVRGDVRSLPGVTVSAQASRSRPARTPASTDTTVGSITVASDRLPAGVLVVSTHDEDTRPNRLRTRRVEWRAAKGVVVRYVRRQQTSRDTPQTSARSQQVELELPGWFERDARNRVNVHAILAENPTSGTPALSSRVSGRFDVAGDVAVTGAAELGVAGDGDPHLRAVRLTSKVRVHRRAELQLFYTYQARDRFVLNGQSFEARLARPLPLATW